MSKKFEEKTVLVRKKFDENEHGSKNALSVKNNDCKMLNQN